MSKKAVVTAAMMEAHRKAYPPPEPLYAEVVIEDAIAVTVRIARSRLELLRGLLPGCNDEEIVLEIVDDFLIRMGAV